jgi:hypothetical protein
MQTKRWKDRWLAGRLAQWLGATALVAAMGAAAWAGVKAGSPVTVRVMSAKVMKAPKFIGSTAGSLSRGDQLTVKEVKGDWYKVEGAASGWIHKTSVAEGKLQLSTQPGGGGSGASRDEVELAGRGFSQDIENDYRNQNPEQDYSHVDKIEKVSIDPAELEAFAGEGGL